jgi:site-specific DNA-methyltransferase (adenine-specific)
MSRILGKTKNWGSRTGKQKTDLVSTGTLSEKLYQAGLSNELLTAISESSLDLANVANEILGLRNKFQTESKKSPKPVYATPKGKLFNGDSIKLLQHMDDNSLDCIFADPPFNLAKEYDNGKSDSILTSHYLEWSRVWIDLCVKKLKPGGSFFLYNIPKWSVPLANYLSQSMTFRNWIAVDLTLSMPIAGRLFPSHYALLYFVKGSKPNVFNPHRIPIKTCRKCGKEQSDYGGYKKKMNPNGVNIKDVWTDIPPVRHSKFKNRDANELHLKLLNRVIDLSTNEGDLIFDPFGGSGTTYAAAELKNRRWIGSELGPCEPIIDRLENLEQDKLLLEKIIIETNTLFTDDALRLRAKSGIPIDAFNISKEQVVRALGKGFLESHPQMDFFEKSEVIDLA